MNSTQGVQAQTLANHRIAQDANLAVVLVMHLRSGVWAVRCGQWAVRGGHCGVISGQSSIVSGQWSVGSERSKVKGHR